MQKAFRITLAFLLSGLILVSGSGLIIGKMVCLRTGHAVIVPQQVEDCCKSGDDCCEMELAADVSFEDNCCDVANVAFSAQDFMPGSDVSVKTPAPLTLFHITEFSSAALAPALTAWNAHPPDERATGHTSDELAFLRVFRI